MNNSDLDFRSKLVERAANDLKEHFDSVQILATFVDEQGTHSHTFGAGDWYARQGMAQRFIKMDQSQDLAREIGKALSPPDDGDAWRKE